MKTKVFGKKIENIYEVDHKWKQIEDEHGEMKTVYTCKPTMTKTSKVKEWTELCSYEGEPRYNSRNLYWLNSAFAMNKLNISEDETVSVEEEIFRADLNEVHLHTDKVVETVDVNKEDSLSICEVQIKAFNKMMIESNNKLMAYCDLHKLAYEDTDCIELFKLVFPNEEYVIEDGVMKVKEKKVCDLTAKSFYIDDCVAPITSCINSATISNGVCGTVSTKC